MSTVRLNVVDLDGTLVSYDPARHFLMAWLRRPRHTIPLLGLALRRLTGRVDRAGFMAGLLQRVDRDPALEKGPAPSPTG